MTPISTGTMRHSTLEIYSRMDFESPAIEVLRQHGRMVTGDGIFPLSDGLGDPPQSLAVLFKLLSHPKAAWIRQVFELQSGGRFANRTDWCGRPRSIGTRLAWVETASPERTGKHRTRPL